MRCEAGCFFVVLVENDQAHFPPYRPYVHATRQMRHSNKAIALHTSRSVLKGLWFSAPGGAYAKCSSQMEPEI
jgi:hypothetical protein